MMFYGIKYKQGKLDYITTVMPMGFIIENYTVLIYGENELQGEDPVYGYQRAPKATHYKKITKEILSDINSQVTTNSIILGINLQDLDKDFDLQTMINTDGCNESVVSLDPKGKKLDVKLRVIDGQHRIKGFEKALVESGEREDIYNYPTNVIMMLMDESYRRPEVTAFTNINSKAKPLKMDLTKLAEYKYDLKEKPDETNIINYLVVSVIKLLNSGEFCTNWRNGIKFDVNSSGAAGIVGLKGFYDTIESLCVGKIKGDLQKINGMPFDEKKQILDSKALEIVRMLGECWNVVFSKWPVATKNELFDNGEYLEIYYDINYYLQKTVGVMAINQLITSCMNGDGIKQFEEIITQSTLTSEDWKVNGLFAGLNSGSGANKIVKRIKNQGL